MHSRKKKKKKKLFREIRNNFNVENFHNMDGTLDVGVVRRLGNLSPTCENLNPHHFRCDDSPKYRVLAILPDFFFLISTNYLSTQTYV